MNNAAFESNLNSEITHLCKIALLEDLGLDISNHELDLAAHSHQIDITANLIPEQTNANARLISREQGILCGQKWVNEIIRQISASESSKSIEIKWLLNDGDSIKPNDLICEFYGNARSLLIAERSAMNFLQALSATASLTQRYVNAMDSNSCHLLDTRKTIPGMRFGQKYAVKTGGGRNHRFGLSDAFLIKENHIMACGGIEKALSSAIKNHPDKRLEIEVENFDELQQAIKGKAQVVMLDNFNNSDLIKAVELVKALPERPQLEASGNVNIDTIAEIARTGVDFISVGALTKDIKALDLSMRIDLIEN